MDSSQLRWGANRKLGSVAGWVKANPRGIVVIEGHSDPSGPSDYNVELSLQRALVARRELVEAGVPPRQLVIVGFGEDGPQVGANRRVAIWATRHDLETVLAFIHALGPSVVRPGDDTASVVGER